MKRIKFSLLFFLFSIFLSAQSNLEITSPCENIDFTGCTSSSIELSVTATTDCSVGSFLTYNYLVDENNDGSFNFSGSSSEFSEVLSVGEHLVIFTVTDQCNSSVTCEYLFTVDTPEDTEPPVPICINGLSTIIIPFSGVLNIGAINFEAGSSFDNCSDYENLQFSFSSNPDDTLLTFDCDDLCMQNGVLEVEIWITDEAGNQDFCKVFVIIQDPNDVCNCLVDPNPTTHQTIVKSSDGCDFEMEYETCINNNFNCFEGVTNLDVFMLNDGDEIFLRKKDNPLNGVTTFDLILIANHIIGVSPLDSPLKELAADVDESGLVTTLDIVLIRAMILQINTEFPSGNSWKFSPDFLVFDQNTFDYEFTAIKLGDINNTANQFPGPCLQGGNISEVRNLESPLQFFSENQFLQKGKSYTIPVFAENYKDLVGGQFTLNFSKEKIRIDKVISENLKSLNKENFGLNQLNAGRLLCSWSTGFKENLEINSPLFELKITALENSTLKEVVEINSTVLNAEAYKEKVEVYEFLDIQLNFIEKISKETKVIPNPFTEFTNISFTNEKEGQVELQVFDVSGKLIFSQDKNLQKGHQQISFYKDDFPAEGIYFYEIKTQSRYHSGKLILQ